MKKNQSKATRWLKENGLHRTSVDMPQKTYEKIEAIAEKNNTSIRTTIAKILERGLNRIEKQPPKKKGLLSRLVAAWRNEAI